MTEEVSIRLAGTGIVADAASYSIERIEQGGGEYQFIRVSFEAGGLTMSAHFHEEDDVEEFITQMRDELVRAKRARLEWETDTGRDTGIREEHDERQ